MKSGVFAGAGATDHIKLFNREEHSHLSSDFGRLSKAEPTHVATPSSTDEIVSTMQHALKHGHSLSVYGHAHCTGSQALSHGGVTVDLKERFCEVDNPVVEEKAGEAYVDIQPGASWKQVFEKVLPLSLTPPTYSDYIALTAGGTVSSGGVGQSSHKKGMQADNVLELDIVTGTGEHVTCSASENPELFYLAKGGYGHFGIITRVRMRLEKAPKNVSLFKCVYLNEADFLADQAKLIKAGFIDTIQAHITSNTPEDVRARVGQDVSEEAKSHIEGSDSPWAYVLEVSQYHDDEADMAELQAHLTETCLTPPEMIYGRKTSFADHVTRVPPILEGGLEAGKPMHHHCCVFMPQSTATEFLKQTLAKSNRKNTGEGTILVIPLFKHKVDSRNIRLPDEEVSYMICFLRRHLSDRCALSELETINGETYHLALELGGTPYPVGSGDFLSSPECWASYYGETYPTVVAAKKTYDPENLLTPGMPIVPAEKKTLKPGAR